MPSHFTKQDSRSMEIGSPRRHEYRSSRDRTASWACSHTRWYTWGPRADDRAYWESRSPSRRPASLVHSRRNSTNCGWRGMSLAAPRWRAVNSPKPRSGRTTSLARSLRTSLGRSASSALCRARTFPPGPSGQPPTARLLRWGLPHLLVRLCLQPRIHREQSLTTCISIAFPKPQERFSEAEVIEQELTLTFVFAFKEGSLRNVPI